MMADLYNMTNTKVGTVTVPDGLFAARWNASLVRQVLHAQQANRRRPWAHAKDRSEVRGGGRKPWRQKGTGRARHGSIRSPLWRGGGKSHGPTNLRDYSEKVNVKMRRRAIATVLSRRFKESEIKFMQTLVLGDAKTKSLVAALHAILPKEQKKNTPPNALLIPAKEMNTALVRASRNLKNVKTLSPRSLNIEDLLKYKTIIIDEHAMREMETCYTV